MTSDSPSPVFEVVFEGDAIAPEAVPLRVLSDALAAIQCLATGDRRQADDDEPRNDSLRLVSIGRGSAVYQIAGPPAGLALPRLKLFGELLSHPEDVDPEDGAMLGPLEMLSAVASRLGCVIALREPGELGSILARITPGAYESIARTLLIEGPTSMVGRVARVEGTSALGCGLRFASEDRVVICKAANAAIAREIGERIDQDVVVDGKATWLKPSWRLYSFTIEAVRQLTRGTIAEALAALRDAGGKDWDRVEDPASYLEVVDRDP